MDNQLYCHATEPEPALINPVDQSAMNKPLGGGLWTSTYHKTYGSGWVQWCLEENFRQNPFNSWVLTPTKDVRILEVDSLATLHNIAKQYPRQEDDAMASMLGQWKHLVDFHAIAKDYDGMHLTEQGLWQCHLPLRQFDGKTLDLYGWDCESTLWFRWAFDHVEHLGEICWEAETIGD